MSDNPLIPVKSPLALTGVFLEVIRGRFAHDQNLEWVYYPGDEGRHNSTIHIEAAGNPQTDDFGKRPAIYAIRNPISYGQTAIRDSFVRNDKKDNELFTCIAQTGFTFSCESNVPAEAEILADIVLSTLLMGSDEIERAFQFRKLGPFSISSKSPTRQDTDICVVQVQMGLSFDVRWGSFRIAPILKEIIAKVKDSAYSSGDGYFVEIYQNSLGVRPDPSTD